MYLFLKSENTLSYHLREHAVAFYTLYTTLFNHPTPLISATMATSGVLPVANIDVSVVESVQARDSDI